MSGRLPFPVLLLALGFVSQFARAGGPIVVGGPAVGNRPPFGLDGQPFTWNPSQMPISYRVDPGPMAVTPSGTTVIDHAGGTQRVQGMFGVWQAVSTAHVSFTNAGALLPAGSYSSGDLKTAQQFNDIIGSCRYGKQSPVIFDADSKLMTSLGLSAGVIGFTSGCALDATTGHIVSAAIVLNGEFQDGINNPGSTRANFELTANQFDEAITHEMGHFLGLDHSQINLNLLFQFSDSCDVDNLAVDVSRFVVPGSEGCRPARAVPRRRRVDLKSLSEREHRGRLWNDQRHHLFCRRHISGAGHKCYRKVGR